MPLPTRQPFLGGWDQLILKNQSRHLVHRLEERGLERILAGLVDKLFFVTFCLDKHAGASRALLVSNMKICWPGKETLLVIITFELEKLCWAVGHGRSAHALRTSPGRLTDKTAGTSVAGCQAGHCPPSPSHASRSADSTCPPRARTC